MLVQASICLIAVLLSFLLLLSSRHLVTFKRWYDPVFLQGLAFFFWGISHFLAEQSGPYDKAISYLLTYLFYLFTLLSFRFYPLPPHLYFSRWKTYLDIALLTVLYVTFFYNILIGADNKEYFEQFIHVQTALFVLACGIPLLIVTLWKKLWEQSNWMLLGMILFLITDMSGHTFMAAEAVLHTVAFGFIYFGHHKLRDMEDEVDVMEESQYLFEKVNFKLRDLKIMAFQIIVTIVILFVFPVDSTSYSVGMALFLVLLAARWFFCNRESNALMKEVFMMSRNLEMQFTENMRKIKSQNENLSQLLSLKQSYEKLLIKSKEQSMRTIHEENVYQMIDEIVHEWYTTMTGLSYVRVVLQSHSGQIVHETVHGDQAADNAGRNNSVTLRLAVEESPEETIPQQFIIVEAITAAIDQTDQEKSFLNQLAIHVRGLIQRSIQHQQTLDLRVMEQEMELASRIQLSLIPKERLVLPHLEAKAVYLPAQYVGGDYVDFVEIDHRYSCYLVADISGHGIPASLLTTGLRNSFRAVIQTSREPQDILYRMNRLMYEDLSRTRSFVTMFVAVVDRQDGVMWTGRAGHPSPFYLSQAKQTVLANKGGPGLGLLPEATYPQDKFWLKEDFTLIIYTDGLTDLGRAEDDNLDKNYWLKLFTSVYQHQSWQGQTDRLSSIEQLVKENISQYQQEDDISLLILDVKLQNAEQKNE